MKILTFAIERELSGVGEFEELARGIVERALLNPLSIWECLEILDLFSNSLSSEYREVSEFLSKKNLYAKLVRELGDDFECELRSKPRERGLLEGYRPLGVICHITPSNDELLPFLAAIEGLITGNINFLKISSSTSAKTSELFKTFLRMPSNQKLAERLLFCEFASSDQNSLKAFLSFADGVSAWGGERALSQIRSLLPVGVRFIPWGHRLSFAYLGSDYELSKEDLADLTHDVTLYAQQACSAPQTLYVEGSWERTLEVAQRVYESLSEKAQPLELDQASQAEVTNYSLLKMTEEALGIAKVFGGPGERSRVIAVNESSLGSSPLNQTLIVKPIERNQLLSILRPQRAFLQSVGLKANERDTAELCDIFFACGATRITSWSKMQDSYAGEPHDGERALTRFLKRVRAQSDELKKYVKWSETKTQTLSGPSEQLVTTKSDFMASNSVNSEHRYVFKSGGSSGKQAISPFSYDDYHRQMQFAADGLLSAGLNPESDRVMNLFFGGQMYGGFLSFTDILEKVDALQFPMSAVLNLELVAQAIVEFKVDTLMGMPSYLYSLFHEQREILANYHGIKKIFYGGEFITEAVRHWYQSEFGVSLIKSASYGSVDAGPVAYQCRATSGGVHHLHQGLHALEILDLHEDRPAKNGQTGRLIYSTPSRLTTQVRRYELGDIGCWVEGECPCGHKTPRFELQGRMGDIFRAGGNFFNYQVFETTLRNRFNYSGPFQITLKQSLGRDIIEFTLEEEIPHYELIKAFAHDCHDFEMGHVVEKCLDVVIRSVAVDDFVLSSGSGKTLRVIETRARS